MKTRTVALASPQALTALLLILPALLVLAVFRYYPVVSAVWHSLFTWNGFTAGRYVGLANYRQALTDPVMAAASLNIARYIAIRVVLNLAFPLLAAELIFHLPQGRAANAYKSLLTIPLAV